MTIEELNVKITADATKFRREMALAKETVDAFRNGAKEAGDQVTQAFGGLISTEVSSTGSTIIAEGAPVKFSTAPPEPIGIPSGVPVRAIAGLRGDSGMRTADVLSLENSETVIGAVSAASQDSQPVSITTTVELDGDKVGESVERFNLRQGKIGNGMDR